MSGIETTDDETLVAYLDGELPPGERKTLETRLVDDETLRARMRTLQQSWDMLTLLPSPAPDDRLVQSTLELVVADLTGKAPSSTSASVSSSRQRAVVGSLAVLAASALVAIIAVVALSRWRLRSQMSDLPIAMDIDAYLVGEDMDLIRALAKDSFWPRVVPPTNADALESFNQVYSDNSTDLNAMLGSLPIEQQSIAASRWDRFRMLSPEDQDELRQRAQRINEQPDARELMETMRLYARWRDQLPSEWVDAIESGDPKKRDDGILKGFQATLDERAELSGRNLSEETIVRINFALIQIVRQRMEDGDNRIRGFVSAIRRRRGLNEDDAFQAAARFLVGENDWRPAPKKGIPHPDGPGGRPGGRGPDEPPIPLTFAELDMIYSILPDSDVADLNELASSEWMQIMILRYWAAEAVLRTLRGDIKSRGLADRYRELPGAQRDIIDLLPPEQAMQQLGDEAIERNGRP
ncbi:MAG: hypothetical protein AAGC97_14340 [Planctomycetota bacterium]